MIFLQNYLQVLYCRFALDTCFYCYASKWKYDSSLFLVIGAAIANVFSLMFVLVESQKVRDESGRLWLTILKILRKNGREFGEKTMNLNPKDDYTLPKIYFKYVSISKRTHSYGAC